MIITAGSTMGLMIGLPFALTQPFPDTTLADVSLFATLGAFGAVAPLMLAHAFQTAPSTAVIVPFHYTQIIWGALLGYFIFGEIPGRDTITGAALLIMGGLALVWSESRRLKG